MKKIDLASLALLGITAGLTVSSCQECPSRPSNPSSHHTAAAEQMNPEMDAFFNRLSPASKRKFMDMDEQHRAMAMELTNASCKGPHNCGGTDPNESVQIQYQNQMQQRSQMNRTMRGN